MPGNTDLQQTQATLANVNDAVTLGPLTNQNVATCKLLGNLAATVQCEVSMDAVSWNNSLCEQANGAVAGTPSQAVTGNEMIYTNVAGYPFVRFRISAVTSGTCLATLRATDAVPRAFTV